MNMTWFYIYIYTGLAGSATQPALLTDDQVIKNLVFFTTYPSTGADRTDSAATQL